MAEVGVVQGMEEGCDFSGLSESGKEEVEGSIGGVMSESPKPKQSARKKSLRSFNSRGRVAKSKPKSPLMWMAEIRRGGFRGKDLKVGGVKGLEVSIRKSKKLEGRGCNVLETVPEYNASDMALKVGDELSMVDAVVGEGGDTEEFDDLPQGASESKGALGSVEAGKEGISDCRSALLLNPSEPASSEILGDGKMVLDGREILTEISGEEGCRGDSRGRDDFGGRL